MDISSINIKEIIETETGSRFNKANKICCPLHNEKTPSFSVKNIRGKEKFHCFGCGATGDTIDFIRAYKGLNYIEACKYLNLPIDENRKTEEAEKDKIINYINWSLNNIEDMKKWQLLKLYKFENEEGKTIYYKGKFKTPNGKEIRYYSMEEGKPKSKRGSEEVPYNLYNVLKTLENEKNIYIVEGEKDADTLKTLGFTATSLKGVKEDKFNFEIFRNAKVFFIGDTGSAGEEYKKHIWNLLKDLVKEFKVIELTGLEELGDNKDVTDWIEKGYTKEDFINCLEDSWDYKKSTKWKYVKQIKKDNNMIYTPLKVWQNLAILLKREKVKLKFNLLNKEVEAQGKFNSTRNELLTDIYTLNQVKGLNMSREEIRYSIEKIALTNSYNPFIDMLKENRNNNHNIIREVFNTISINNTNNIEEDYYFNLFRKWILNAVKMPHNTLKNSYESQGVLVLQGSQGTFKSTFFKTLLPNSNWFKGGNDLDPTNKDSVRKNTKYPLVELGELDHTLKSSQAKLKAFLSDNCDEYRSPYQALEEKHPRITTFCATVNKADFLKDETGSRRFWIIPILKCDIEKLKQINIYEFWGAVYDLWLSKTVIDYLTPEELEELSTYNIKFASKNDISITLDENINWEQMESAWEVYQVKELCKILEIKEKKALVNELERRRIPYKGYKINGKTKKGYKLPRFTQAQLLGVEKIYN